VTRYNNDTWANGLEEAAYREGVDRVIHFLKDWDDEGRLIDDIRDAIEEGVI
jgi:hypothetical protein